MSNAHQFIIDNAREVIRRETIRLLDNEIAQLLRGKTYLAADNIVHNNRSAFIYRKANRNRPAPGLEVTSENWDEHFDTNVKGGFFAAQEAAKLMIPQGWGRIVFISSQSGLIGIPGQPVYCATKGAITAFTKSLAIEEAAHGVRVNAVLPGNILSDSRKRFVESTEDPAALDAFVDSWQPTGRSGTNEEVGQLCLFLASDDAAYVTGTEMIISGGSELGYGVKYPLMFAGQEG